VFLDGDVYLTGAVDPFENMLPLSNDTWDIQFQPDHVDAMDYNIGWYFARATENTFEYFNRSYAMWNETHEWDQAVMNDVGQVMELEEHSLRVHHLDLSVYKVRRSTHFDPKPLLNWLELYALRLGRSVWTRSSHTTVCQ
jgi:hypothetical protein